VKEHLDSGSQGIFDFEKTKPETTKNFPSSKMFSENWMNRPNAKFMFLDEMYWIPHQQSCIHDHWHTLCVKGYDEDMNKLTLGFDFCYENKPTKEELTTDLKAFKEHLQNNRTSAKFFTMYDMDGNPEFSPMVPSITEMSFRTVLAVNEDGQIEVDNYQSHIVWCGGTTISSSLPLEEMKTKFRAILSDIKANFPVKQETLDEWNKHFSGGTYKCGLVAQTVKPYPRGGLIIRGNAIYVQTTLKEYPLFGFYESQLVAEKQHHIYEYGARAYYDETNNSD